jgi:N-acetylglutamate synthase-like GNAT family acetyltransferase
MRPRLVAPEVRSRGYGTAMLAACRSEAGALDCSVVWLNAAPRTAPFYEAIGFERVDTYVALAGS